MSRCLPLLGALAATLAAAGGAAKTNFASKTGLRIAAPSTIGAEVTRQPSVADAETVIGAQTTRRPPAALRDPEGGDYGFVGAPFPDAPRRAHDGTGAVGFRTTTENKP